MPIKGNAFMIIWHDIKAESEPEYHRWHTREHMPERLNIPGFQRGRRGVAWPLDRHRYLTLYEAKELATFGSPEYLQRLNNPTPWSVKVQPAFLNFVRSACDIVLSRGEGVGGAMATIRIGLDSLGGERSGEDGLRAAAPAIADAIMQIDGISSIHVGVARPEVTGAKTKETELRGTNQDGRFDAVVIVDGVGRREVEAALPRIMDVLRGKGVSIQAGDAAVYDMAYALDSLL